MKKGQMRDVRSAKKLEREWQRRTDQLRKKAEKRKHEWANTAVPKPSFGDGQQRTKSSD
jgi:hypothetical protein